MRDLLPKGWYYATITQVRTQEVQGASHLFVVFTIDSGEYAYRNIIKTYPLNRKGIEQLDNDMMEMGYVLFDDTSDMFFFKQFTETKMRAYIHVDRYVSQMRGIVTNVILERKIAEKPADKDVTKEKNDEHYTKDNKGRTLPLRQ